MMKIEWHVHKKEKKMSINFAKTSQIRTKRSAPKVHEAFIPPHECLLTMTTYPAFPILSIPSED